MANCRVQLESPTFQLAPGAAVSLGGDVQPGDTMRATVALQYNPNTRPFSLETLGVRLVDPNGVVVATAPAFVFFTPYGTVEVWSRADPDRLNRVWDVPDPATVPARVYVDPATIPASDLTDEELANPDVPQRLKSVPGLAYAIPMKDTGQDAEDSDADAAAGT